MKEGRHVHRRGLSIPGVSNDTNLSQATKSQCPLRPIGWVTHYSQPRIAVSYYDRLKTLFWISVSNFVFPVILDLALLVLAFRDAAFLDGAYVLMVSNYVDIVGVLLATIWTTSTKYPHAQPGFTPSGAAIRSRTSPRFAIVTAEEQGDEGPYGDSIPMTVFRSSPATSDTQV